MAKFLKRENIMLAYPAEEKRIQDFPLMELEDGSKERKMFHQPKLNGERSRTEWFNELPYLFSSYGNDFRFLDNIQEQLRILKAAVGTARKYDGEIYVHGWSRERIDSALRRTKNKSNDTQFLEYHIFDVQDFEKRQYERLHEMGLLEQVIHELKLPNIKVVPYGLCSDVDWLHHCGCYIEEGYEGIILRNPFAFYEVKRVPGLIKFKPTEKDEYEIVGVNEAISLEGQPKGMVGSFTVRAKDEPGSCSTFDVGAGKLKHDKRIEYWHRRWECIGKMLLVKHELLRTSGQVPIAAVTIDVIW